MTTYCDLNCVCYFWKQDTSTILLNPYKHCEVAALIAFMFQMSKLRIKEVNYIKLPRAAEKVNEIAQGPWTSQ